MPIEHYEHYILWIIIYIDGVYFLILERNIFIKDKSD